MLIFGLTFFWTLSTLYCLRWHYRKKNLYYGTFLISLLMGPAIALILMDDDQQTKRERKEELKERESNERHRRWFQTLGLINGQRIPNWGRTIPPPPPISRVERARRERDDAIRSAIERIEPPNRRYNNKDFKFFRG